MREMYSIFYKIKNIIRWIPVIWRDVPYDYTSIYSILLAKFRFDREFYLSDRACSVESKEVARDYDTCAKILKRLISEDYYSKELFEMWPDDSLEVKDQNFAEYFNSRSEDQIKKSMNIYDKIEKANSGDREDLFNLMKNRIKFWWD